MRAVVLLLVLGAAPAAAQHPRLSGYYLNVGMGIDAGPFNSSSAFDVQRLRVMGNADLGPVRVDVAYEHVLSLSSSSLAGASGFAGGLGTARTGGDWLPLQGTIERGEHAQWRHRVDRLAVSYAAGALELSLGRQPVSWATTLLLTPADPFVPFDPSEPFREYRAGVDVARVRFFPGPFTQVEAVFRPTETTAGAVVDTTFTALGRAQTAVGRWELAAWGGVVHDEWAGALAATATVSGAVLRAEGVVRFVNDEPVLRAAVGVDRSFVVAERTLYMVVEYQHDEFGAAQPSEIPAVALSAPAQRGELLVVSRDAAALQASYQVHPLVSASALGLVSLSDGSVLATPAVSYLFSDEVTLSGGVFAGFGEETTGLLPASEFGIVPLVAYVAATAFF
ncbi:MAG: hypothetical protein PVF27_07295 [Gemmatimonadales bacterium]|jgi:hypothetical protein